MAAAGPSQIGVPVDWVSLNAKLGAGATSLKKSDDMLKDVADYAAAFTAQQLVDTFGCTIEEANLFKSACSEVPSITTAVDALAFLSQAWGIGS